uniref:Uncharacterized protein n=1 Tax=Rhizophagus irregularis (strain DAOM 181602 / DAOM 197198 / MUCL 43194) TaxID=747089 RepID=U9U386_RHIID
MLIFYMFIAIPIEEFMRSLIVLYVAISNTPSWELARANAIAELRLSLIGLQSRYNLLDRSLEFVLQPACVGILLWGVTVESFLTGKYTRESAAVLNQYLAVYQL